jgi:hypothetical protein
VVKELTLLAQVLKIGARAAIGLVDALVLLGVSKGAAADRLDQLLYDLNEDIEEGDRIARGEPRKKNHPFKGTSEEKSAYADLIAKYFPGQEDRARRVMIAESSGNPNAVNNRNRNGTQDTGLFQINDVHIAALRKAGIIADREDLKNPETNVAAARYVYNQQGWKAWKSSESRWGRGDNLISNAAANYKDMVANGAQNYQDMVSASYRPVGGGDYQVTTTVGDINVHVENPGASADEIAHTVKREVIKTLNEKQGKATARLNREFGSVFN